VLAVVAPCLLTSTPAGTTVAHERRPVTSVRDTATATVVALPPVVQSGARPAGPPDDPQVVAQFAPARPGQEVELLRRRRTGWRVVATSAQDRWGSTAFPVTPGTYRARTTGPGGVVRTRTVRARSWQPVFEDTFSADDLDPAVWNDQKREHTSVWGQRTCARADPTTRSVRGGVLRLGIRLDPAQAGVTCHHSTGVPGSSPYLLNSQVATEFTRHFRYGVFAARMRLQRSRGMHSAFWLLPRGTRYSPGRPEAGTEIDVVEYFGERRNARDSIRAFVHYYDTGMDLVSLGGTVPEARRVLGAGTRWWEEYHVFSLEWSPTGYVFRVDGREFHRESDAVSQFPEYLILSMTTSDFELDDLAADEMGDTARVDWVRVWEGTYG
jgi:beta-glucanase (GH16 family)